MQVLLVFKCRFLNVQDLVGVMVEGGTEPKLPPNMHANGTLNISLPHSRYHRVAAARSNAKTKRSLPREDTSCGWLRHFYLTGGRFSQELCKLFSSPPKASVPFLLSTDKKDNATSPAVVSPGPTRATIDLSIIILTFNSSDRLGVLLDSLLMQKTDVKYELIIADNGCRNGTKEVVHSKLNGATPVSYNLLSFCDNPGYSVGNNRAANVTSDSSSWILFLNDDLELMDGFIQHMFDLGQAKQNAAAVGCKLVSDDGSKLLEAGSIIWSDASCHGYGRGSMEPDAPEFSYTRPTDYVSGACLMMQKADFNGYGGFDSTSFPAFYEDTDLQMHINHDLGKEVWLQPLAVARHHEHGTFGSESVKLMQAGQKVFAEKWAGPLQEHFHPPGRADPLHILHARDGRRNQVPNILYLDSLIPNKKFGSGYGRAFDNLVMLAELGYKITVTATAMPIDGDGECDAECRGALQQASVEVIPPTPLPDNNEDYCVGIDSVLKIRKDFYAVIIVSRPATFERCKDVIQRHCQASHCSIIYDSEALCYRRDEMLLDMAGKGLVSNVTAGALHVYEERLDKERRKELGHLSHADGILTVSQSEKRQIDSMANVKAPVVVVGHTMEPDPTVSAFASRGGILFIAAFHESLYYNGDAIWYFLCHIYPLILKNATESIPLTIAGKGIPKDLRDLVQDLGYESNITFMESPSEVRPLYETARVFIAPHLYGAGVQYKVRYQCRLSYQ